jgi:hypothetical protein
MSRDNVYISGIIQPRDHWSPRDQFHLLYPMGRRDFPLPLNSHAEEPDGGLSSNKADKLLEDNARRVGRLWAGRYAGLIL